jgi:mannosyl-oligosaccharide glucosidase
LKILRSWAQRFEANGWVAREQVPGAEARSAIPVEYMVQNAKHANPPALLFSVLNLANSAKDSSFIKKQLMMILPMLERNLKWLIRTQRGQIHPEFCRLLKDRMECPQVLKMPAFRWRGRSKHHNLNSGLDDYPRGDFANRYELHVDLACWIAFGAKSLLHLHRVLGVRNVKAERKLGKVYRKIMFSLEHLHWDKERRIFSDLTISDEGQLMFAQHQGYVNLFPLIFGFIHPDSDHFKATLDLIEDEDRLWTPYGIRSLSKSDPYFMKGDEYWTGPIWININYLVLSSLKKV